MSTPTPIQRLYFVDSLRVGSIILVLAHHAGQACSPTGGLRPIGIPLAIFSLSRLVRKLPFTRGIL